MTEKTVVHKLMSVAHKLPPIRPLAYACWAEFAKGEGDCYTLHCQGCKSTDAANDICVELALENSRYYAIQCVTVVPADVSWMWVRQESVRHMTISDAALLTAYDAAFVRLILDDMASLDGDLSKQSCLTV